MGWRKKPAGKKLDIFATTGRLGPELERQATTCLEGWFIDPQTTRFKAVTYSALPAVPAHTAEPHILATAFADP